MEDRTRAGTTLRPADLGRLVAPVLLGALMMGASAIAPWWRLRVIAPEGTSAADVVGFRGWAGWIVFLLAIVVSTAALPAMGEDGDRRIRLAALSASGGGAGALFTCVVATVDRSGALALDLGPYADVAGVSVVPRWGMGIAVVGGILVVVGGLRASRPPRRREEGDPEAIGRGSGDPGEDRISG